MITKSGVIRYSKWNENNDFLYHYTTDNALFSILKGMSFRLSSFNPKLDDPVDGEALNRLYYTMKEDNTKKNDIIQILSKYRLISMTSDYKTIDNIAVNGGENSLLWYMYGREYKGACIVFNKKTLLEKIRRIGWNVDTVSVQYGRLYPNPTLSDLKFESTKKNDVLCWKENSWREQKEERVLCYSNTPISSLFDVTGAIDHIILGYRFTEYKKLYEAIFSDDSKAYGMFYSESFSGVKLSGGFIEEGEIKEFSDFLREHPDFKSINEEIKKKAEAE